MIIPPTNPDSTAKRCFGVEKPGFSLERRAILNRNPVFAVDSILTPQSSIFFLFSVSAQ
jgi:hypothetical protein